MLSLPCICCGSGPVSCTPCTLPNSNLTLTWTNALIGNGSTPLIYNGSAGWNSSCSNGLLYALGCVGGSIVFCVTYFLSGACPTGQPQKCCSNTSNPFALTLSSYTCSPLALHYTVAGTNCPVLWNNGFTAFDIS